MKLETLSAFCAVADTKSFSQAAEALYVTQPTASKYVAQLEQELGARLLDRTGGISLTPLGQTVYLHAKRILEEWRDIRNEAENTRLGERPVLRIGYTFDRMAPFFTEALSDPVFPFRGLDLSLRFGEGTTMTQLLLSGQIDCAVMHLPSLDPAPTLETRLIKKCDLQLVVPEGHSLAEQSQVTLAQIAKETDVRNNREERYYAALDSAFRNLGLPPIKHMFIQDVSDTIPVMQYYNRICFTPDIYDFWENCHKIPILDWSVDYSLIFVCVKGNQSKILEAFFQAMCHVMEQK